MRRRNSLIANRTRQNQGYVPNSQSDQGTSNGGFDNNNPRVWTTTAYPPPSYDNIYESSLPINPLPDYNSSLNNLVKKTDLRKNEQTNTQQAVPTSNSDSYSVTFSHPDEMVTITNPNFNMNDVTSDGSTGGDSSTDSAHSISVDDLQIVGKKGVVSGGVPDEKI